MIVAVVKGRDPMGGEQEQESVEESAEESVPPPQVAANS